MTGLQLSNSGTTTITSGSPIIFGTVIASTDSNMSYSSSTGNVTFAAVGQYYVFWTVSPLTNSVAYSTSFGIIVNSAKTANYSSSMIHNGCISGSFFVNATASMTLSLANISTGTVSLTTTSPANASLTIVNAASSSVALEGFSAYLSNVSASANLQLTGFSTASPYFASPSGSFNASTGIYTVPVTGTYLITANINFATTAAISATLGSSVNPAFAVNSLVSSTTTTLMSALLPVLNLSVTLLTVRAVLGSGNVNLIGEFALASGAQISLNYVSGGLTVGLNIGNSGTGVLWSVQRIT